MRVLVVEDEPALALRLQKALEAADFVPRRPAGRGAVREVCELLLQARS